MGQNPKRNEILQKNLLAEGLWESRSSLPRTEHHGERQRRINMTEKLHTKPTISIRPSQCRTEYIAKNRPLRRAPGKVNTSDYHAKGPRITLHRGLKHRWSRSWKTRQSRKIIAEKVSRSLLVVDKYRTQNSQPFLIKVLVFLCLSTKTALLARIRFIPRVTRAVAFSLPVGE